MQGGNGVLDSLCHCVNFRLLGNILVADNGGHSGLHSGEILVVVLVQCVCLSNGFVNLGVIGVLILQGSNGILDSLRHCVNFRLLGNILVTDNGIHGGLDGGKVLVVVLVQCVCLGNGLVNLGIVGR